MIIGITGPIASGKSTLTSNLLKSKKFYHFDGDVECKRIAIEQKENVNKIFEKYGYSNLTNGEVSKVIFSNSEIYKEYTDYIYSFLIEDFKKVRKEHTDVIVDGINLFILRDSLDILLYIKVNPIIRFIRMIKRDHKKHSIFNLIKKFKKQKGLFNSYRGWDIPVIIVRSDII